MENLTLDGTVTLVLILSVLNILFAAGRWARGTEFTSEEVKRVDAKFNDLMKTHKVEAADHFQQLERRLTERVVDLEEHFTERLDEKIEYMKEKWDDWHLARQDAERRVHDRLTAATQTGLIVESQIKDLRSRVERLESRRR